MEHDWAYWSFWTYHKLWEWQTLIAGLFAIYAARKAYQGAEIQAAATRAQIKDAQDRADTGDRRRAVAFLRALRHVLEKIRDDASRAEVALEASYELPDMRAYRILTHSWAEFALTPLTVQQAVGDLVSSLDYHDYLTTRSVGNVSHQSIKSSFERIGQQTAAARDAIDRAMLDDEMSAQASS